jgi:hypothetical protein
MRLQPARFLLISIVCQLLVGCHTLWQPAQSPRTPLPPEIAGTWQAQDNPWRVVLSPDGTVSSAVIPMCTIEVRPNQVSRTEMKDGSWSTFKAGDCTVQYSPDTRELFVTVRMDSIHVVFLDNVIEGNSTDRLIGPVSQDGKSWAADWISVFDYGPRFPQDANDVVAEPLIFEKIVN